MSHPPNGWYPDPHGPTGQQRWWDGTKWTEHTQQPAPVPAAVSAKKKTGLGTWIVLGVLAVIVIAVVSGNSSSSDDEGAVQRPAQFREQSAATEDNHPLPAPTALTNDAPSGAVAGVLSRECDELFDCASPDAARRLSVSEVYCFWRGHNVMVHVRLHNPMNARVSVSITPKYFIEDGGQHGTSFAGDLPLKVAAHRSRDFTGNAGHPEGVADGTQISKCAPHFHDVDIG